MGKEREKEKEKGILYEKPNLTRLNDENVGVGIVGCSPSGSTAVTCSSGGTAAGPGACSPTGGLPAG